MITMYPNKNDQQAMIEYMQENRWGAQTLCRVKRKKKKNNKNLNF